jgi:hypothetical protein
MKTFLRISAIAFGCTQLWSASIAGVPEGCDDWVEFAFTNRSRGRIVSGRDVERSAASDIRGLVLNDDWAHKCPDWGGVLTNVVYLSIRSELPDPLSVWASAVTNFSRLGYLHFNIRKAERVGGEVEMLTNISHISYLGIDAINATNIDAKIYAVQTTEQMVLRFGSVRIPDGVSRLRRLWSLDIYGNRENSLSALPSDLNQSLVTRVRFTSVRRLDTLLPALPHGLAEMSAVDCGLMEVPAAWLRHAKLQQLDLKMNRISVFPSDFREAPSLGLIDLDRNNISNLPAIQLAPKSRLKIVLMDNPVQQLGADNSWLIENGYMEVLW